MTGLFILTTTLNNFTAAGYNKTNKAKTNKHSSIDEKFAFQTHKNLW